MKDHKVEIVEDEYDLNWRDYENSYPQTIAVGFSKVKPNRQMKEYEQVLLWCKTFLLENTFSLYKGKEIAFALLFDMNLLFESYVGAYLKHKGYHVSLQDKGKHLSDIYQLFAYGKKYKNEELYLIYPRDGEKQQNFEYKYEEELCLHVSYFDVLVDWRESAIKSELTAFYNTKSDSVFENESIFIGTCNKPIAR